MLGDFFQCRGALHTVKGSGVYHDTRIDIGLGLGFGIECPVDWIHHDEDIEIVFFCKIEIPLIVGRYRHHRAGTVFHQSEIGGIDRHLSAAERICAMGADKNPLFFIGVHGTAGSILQHHPFDKRTDRFRTGGPSG